MFYGDGSVYDGEWEAGLEMGFGRLYMPSGDMYEGHWKDGKRHGSGEYHFQSRGQVMKVRNSCTFSLSLITGGLSELI